MKKLKLTIVLVLAGIGFLSFNNGKPDSKVGLDIGNEIPELSTNLINGDHFALEDLKGKMVLIDFWASYHAPSRMVNYQKEILRKKFSESEFHNGKGFEVVSISLDRFMSPLKEAVELDEIQNFYHICDLKGVSGHASTFQINSPISILIDGDGRVVTKSSSLQKISDSLAFLVRN